MGDLPLADTVACSVAHAQITMAHLDVLVFLVLFTG